MKKTLSLISFSLITGLASFALQAGQADNITVSDPYAREIPPGAPASASFMELKNNSAEDILLTAASSEAAQIVELHTHTMDGGVMRMRKIDSIRIPANSSIALQPGGDHIMLINPIAALKAGQQIQVTLNFNDGSQKQVAMPVKSLKKMMRQQMQMDHGHHNHDQMMNHHHH